MKLVLILTTVIALSLWLTPISNAGISDLRSELFSKYKWSENCESEFRESLKSLEFTVPNFGITEFYLSPNVKILLVQCSIAAYQSVYEFIRVYKPLTLNFSYSLRFRTKVRNSSGVIVNQWKRQLLGNPTVSTSPFKISNLEKGRGLGDCGTFESFDGFMSSPFMLAKIVKTHPNCDGNTDYNTWESLI